MSTPKSKRFYKISKSAANFATKVAAEGIKVFLNTHIGQGFLRKIIGFAVDHLFDAVIVPFVRVGVIKIGYFYDVNEAENKIKKLNSAQESDDVELYIRTLNDIRK